MNVPSMTTSRVMNSTNMDTELHRIESEAYGAILRALTAQGGPSWGHLDTLVGLRRELRISEAEHKALVAKAEADDSVIVIRQWHEGIVEEKKLRPNYVNPPPPVSSMSQASSKRLKTLHIPVSSSSNYVSGAQPLPAATPSTLATHFSSQCGETAIFFSRESIIPAKKPVCHNSQGSIVNKGMIMQQKKGHQVSGIDNIKKKLGTIEIRQTNKLIHEVERLIYGGNYPELVQVEKAKSLLEEHERAIIQALEKLAEFTDDEESCDHYDEQQRNGHQLAATYAFYEQANTVKGYYSNGLSVGHANGGAQTSYQPGRYLVTP